MLKPEVQALVPTWNERKLAQWARIEPQVLNGNIIGMPLDLVRSGFGKSTFMLTCNTGDFYESVIFGRLPEVHRVPVSKNRPNEFREAKESETPRHKLGIDLSDADIDAVLSLWRMKQTALVLACVPSVWRGDGKEYVKPK
jgi:hypothetical protein